MKLPDNITVVILSDEDARNLSIRHALRCIRRDCRSLLTALAGHCRRYLQTYSRAWSLKNHVWTRTPS